MPVLGEPYVQDSFIGGMNLLDCDTSLQPNQYRVGFNIRNRQDDLVPTFQSVQDPAIPQGEIQDALTFGNYVVIFVGGSCWYRLYNATGWRRVLGFKMSSTAPRFWVAAVPVSTTNFLRLAFETDDSDIDANAPVVLASVTSAFSGNLPGLVVQDNINQPQFIYLQSNGLPKGRTLQTFGQWTFTMDGSGGFSVDKREYVPIGNVMAYVDGILYVASQDGNYIYRSVSGRPLDFVVNIDNDGMKVGDATTTSYSVGTGPIQCMRGMSDGSLFVAAANANFSVAKNMTPGAPQLFGEYTFIRKFLFNATVLSDRAILDSKGDTKAVTLNGIRSFNAVVNLQNEGRNSEFSRMIQPAFDGVVQNPTLAAAILYDNDEYYGIQTSFGPALAVYDTIRDCWTSFDIAQTGGERIKILFKIELNVQRLFAVTESNKFYTLYASSERDTGSMRTRAFASSFPGNEMKLQKVRAIVDNVKEDVVLTALPLVNNRAIQAASMPKEITYVDPVYPITTELPELNDMLYNAMWAILKPKQGYKTACIFSFTGDCRFMSYSYEYEALTPENPLTSQRNG